MSSILKARRLLYLGQLFLSGLICMTLVATLLFQCRVVQLFEGHLA